MKIIIAGSRGITDYKLVQEAIQKSGFKVTEVISGCARGVDKLGEKWAEENKIPIVRFRPDWDKHGKKAGYLRNKEMADYADGLVAIWDGLSRGTKHMIDIAEEKLLEVYVLKFDKTDSPGYNS